MKTKMRALLIGAMIVLLSGISVLIVVLSRPANYQLKFDVVQGGQVEGAGEYRKDSDVTVKATPDVNYIFDGWYEGETLKSNSPNYSFKMPGNDLTLKAKFTRTYMFTLTADPAEGGIVETLSGSKFIEGESISVKATAKTGYRFEGWYEGETLKSTSLTYSFQMPDKDLIIQARFIRVYDFVLRAEMQDGGTIEAPDETQFAEGETISVKAAANADYLFVGWYEGDTLKSSNSTYSFQMPSNNVILQAKFVKVYAFTLTADPSTGGTVERLSGSQFIEGETISVKATANAGYLFMGWYEGDTLKSSSSTYNFQMLGRDLALKAKFNLTYSLTLTADPSAGGTVERLSGSQFIEGEYISVRATAKSGYKFVGWYEGGTLRSSSSTYSFQMPGRDLVLKAAFEVILPSALTTEGTPGGTLNELDRQLFYEGETINLKATAESGYLFVGWYEGETLVSNAANFNYTMPGRDVTLTAKFMTAYTLTLDADPSNGGTTQEANGKTAFAAGQTVALRATPNAGYAFQGWYEGTTLVSNVANFNYTMPARDITLTAKFVRVYTLTIVVDPVEGGTAQDINGFTEFAAGSPVLLRSTINAGYRFTG